MNKGLNLIFAIALSALTLIACSKNESSKDCSTGPGSANAPTKGSVTYFVNLQGGGHVTSVVYQAPTGPVNLANPIAPWSVTYVVDSGAVLSINAVGSGVSGLSAGYKFTNGSTVLIDSTSCTP